jgi:hypothetical protein
MNPNSEPRPVNPYPKVRFFESAKNPMVEIILPADPAGFAMGDGDKVIREVRETDAETYPRAWADFVASHKKGGAK